MALLEALPNPLLVQILSYLGHKEKMALSSTNAFFQDLAHPMIYQEIRWVWKGDPLRDPPVYLLLRTLVEQPSLAAHVEHLTLEGQTQKIIWSSHEPRPVDLSPLKGLVDELQASPPDLWKDLVDKGVLDVFVALLLSRLPNLKSLRLGFEFQSSTPYTAAVLRVGLLPQKAVGALSQITFKKLYRVSFCQDEMEAGMTYLSPILPGHTLGSNPDNLGDLEPLLFSKSITTLSLWLQNEPDLIWPERRSSSSSLTSLILHHSEAREHTLKSLLGQLASLQVLEYHYHGCTTERRQRSISTYLDCAVLSDAFEQVKNTIRYLEVSADWYSIQNHELEWRSHWGIFGHLKSLHEYHHLRRLTVPLVVLLGWSPATSVVKLAETLPLSLEEICFTDDLIFYDDWEWMQTDYLDRFRDYLYNWNQHTPGLRRVSMRMNNGSSWRWGPRMDRKYLGVFMPPQHVIRTASETQEALKEMCESVGIDFRVIRNGVVMSA